MGELLKQHLTQVSHDANLNYWEGRWQKDQIGFHRFGVNERFEKNLLPKLVPGEEQKSVVFPLCGKTADMMAVLDTGHRVIGIEGSPTAIETFFKENQIVYEIEKDATRQLTVYKGIDRPVTIYCGDFFTFNASLPRIDYIWDRAAFVAIDPPARERYRNTLFRLMTPGHTQLHLVCVKYDDPKHPGPPHSVDDDDITRFFRSECSAELVEVNDHTDDYNAQPYMSAGVDCIHELVYLIIRKQA